MRKAAFTYETSLGAVSVAPSHSRYRVRLAWWRASHAGALGPWSPTPRTAVLRLLAALKNRALNVTDF